MNILLISPPVCTPTVMPFSLAMMQAELTAALEDDIQVLDLNSLFHYNEFNQFYQNGEYFTRLTNFIKHTKVIYPTISKDVLNHKRPLGFEKILSAIVNKSPDVVGISLTYNSQIFYTKPLIEELKKRNIKIVIGGPADFSKIMKGTTVLGNAQQLIDHLIKLGATPHTKKVIISFKDFNPEQYLTKDLIYPLRTSRSCPYKLCTFCTHHGNHKYSMLNLNLIKEAIIHNQMKKVCFIDDDIPLARLKELANVLKPLNVEWWCQLRPLKQLIPILPQLKESGLTSVAWGVESGCQRILDLMQKGTNLEDIKQVLRASHELGIKNMAYLLFGLPGETEDEFNQTINFIENNHDIDLVSTSVFGLQQGSRIFANPEEFGVKEVTLEPRTLLSDKIHYEPVTGLTQETAMKLKKKYTKSNNVPDVIAVCKEQILNVTS